MNRCYNVFPVFLPDVQWVWLLHIYLNESKAATSDLQFTCGTIYSACSGFKDNLVFNVSWSWFLILMRQTRTGEGLEVSGFSASPAALT